jgi:hypothetical protein
MQPNSRFINHIKYSHFKHVLMASADITDETNGWLESGFSGLVVSMLASGTQVHGFTPGRSRRIFRAKKSSTCLPSEGK